MFRRPAPMTDAKAKFCINDFVFKHTGDYRVFGVIRAVFRTGNGNIRYVVEHENGILHIYSDKNLWLVKFE
jgi:hypothetical protein